MARLCVRLFGTFQATLDGVAVPGFASDKVRALLAYLAVEAAQPHRRERLAGLLWPDVPEASAHASLRTALANLRTAIGDPRAAPPYLLVSRQTIQFNSAASVWIDVAAFTGLAGLVQRQEGDLAGLEQAVPLYCGDFLEGFSLGDASLFEEWALLNRERYRRLVMDTLRRLADGYGQRGEYEQALAYAWRQVELDPWRETAHQQLMRLLSLTGRVTDALIQYETCCRLLAEELGVAPAAATVALYDQIRSGQLRAPAAPVQFRKPMVELPSSLDQDEAAGSERSLFVGRKRELARLDACLDLVMGGQGAVVLISGEAGSGKTALMAEFARRAMAAHRDLVVASGECSAYAGLGDPYLPFCGLMAMLTGDVQADWTGGAIGLGHARRLLQAMPAAIVALLTYGPQVLGVLLPRESFLDRASLAAHDGDPWLQPLRERLQQPQISAEHLDQSQLFQQTTNVLRALSDAHPLLLILDDLQWAGPSSLSMLFHLGRRLQGRRILFLAAYRPEEVAPGRDGERHPLEKLLTEVRRTYGDVRLDLDQVAAYEGRAFVDALLDAEPNRLGEDFRNILFRHTAGHPLFTIELLRAMQERGELQRDETGRWSAGPDLDWARLPARAEGVIEERLDRLDEKLHEVLAVACVEGEQFTAQVVARVLDMGERRLLRCLSRELARRHRLVRWLGGHQVGPQRLLRYRFAHALFQQYLYARLSPGERQLLHRDIAAALEDLYQGHSDAIAPQLARHYSEAGDDLAALRYLTVAADRALAGYAGGEAEVYFRRALHLAQDDARRTHLLEGLGLAQAGQSRFTEAIQTWREAIERCRALGDLEGMARLYARSANAAWWDGDLPLGLRLCEEGLQAMAGAQDSPGQARLLHEAGRAYYYSGCPEQASSLCRQALEMAEQLGAVEVQADVLVTLGALPGQSPQSVLAVLTRAAKLAEGAALPDIAFRAHNSLGCVKATTHGPRPALDQIQQAVQLSRQTGNVAQEILGLGNVIEGQLTLGDLEQAQASLSRIRQLVGQLDDPGSSGGRIRRLEATVLVHQGEWAEAARLLRLCQAEARQQNHLPALFLADWFLARALLESGALPSTTPAGDLHEAERALLEAIEIGRATGEAEAGVWCRCWLGAVYADQGRQPEARTLLSEARAAADDWPFPIVEAALVWAEARLAAADAQWAEAVAAYESLAATYAQFAMRWDRARTLIDWAGAHASRGEPADSSRARALLDESYAMFVDMGFSHYAELVERRLKALPDQG